MPPIHCLVFQKHRPQPGLATGIWSRGWVSWGEGSLWTEAWTHGIWLFQTDGVGIAVNCRVLSWCRRLAGRVEAPPRPPQHTHTHTHTQELVRGSYQVPAFTLWTCACVLVYCLSRPLEHKLRGRRQGEPLTPTMLTVPRIKQSPHQTPRTCLLNEWISIYNKIWGNAQGT